MSFITIGGACLNQIPLDWENNLHHIKSAIEAARAQNVLHSLPARIVHLRIWVRRPVFKRVVTQKMLRTVVVTCAHHKRHDGLFGPTHPMGGHVYNTTCAIENGKILGFYAKQQLANEGVHYENRWFTPWPSGKIAHLEYEGEQWPIGDVYIQSQGINIGFEICEDAWDVDRSGAPMIDRNIHLVLNPSASHFAFKKANYREYLIQLGSEKFECLYLYTNLLGNEAGRMIFDGDVIFADRGKLLQRNKRLSFRSFNLVTLDYNFVEKESRRQNLQPDYDSQNEEFAAVEALALFDYLRKSRSNGFVLSLSGGADSTACAILVSEMVRRGLEELGPETFLEKSGLIRHFEGEDISSLTPPTIVGKILTTAYQGTKNSSSETLESANELANAIGAGFSHWTIDEEVQTYTQKFEQALSVELNWEKDDITLQNIQARARSPIIWMVANYKNALLLTTSNRSEGDVGYATMDGDTSGSLAPIAGVDKQFITQWLRWAENQLGYPALRFVNSLQPTAELRPQEIGQSDETDLMPYRIIVAIERLAIKERKAPLEVFEILKDRDLEDDELLLLHIEKFSACGPGTNGTGTYRPSFHIDDFNIDPRTWCRFPILSSGFKTELEEMKTMRATLVKVNDLGNGIVTVPTQGMAPGDSF